MPAKFERCVQQVKRRSPSYNPWAICSKTVGRYGGHSTGQRIITPSGQTRLVYQSARDRFFYVENKRKYYI